jgi:CheY-like chemotaxis protein
MEQHRTVLLVDDDHLIRRSLSRLLSQNGYNVLVANNVPSALLILDGTEELHAIVTDLDMPILNGEDMAREARARKPGVRIVLNTGRPEAADHTLFDKVCTKGGRAGELLQRLR